MKIAESWLRALVDLPLSGEELAHLLTMAGLEVEGVEPVAPSFEGVVVASVLEAGPHPGADRLRLCRVDTGSEVLQIVCGAPNVRPGLRVACATVGATLPGMRIAAAKVRGVESFGMLCSASELGLGDGHDGILELDARAPLGTDLREFLELDDRILELKLTPNRADCLSAVGLAREIVALTGAAWREQVDTRPVVAATGETRAIELAAPQACPRYCGRVIRGVNPAAATPDWMLRRLERCGVRPVSSVVDVTNYVMLELGQPLHGFDLARLAGTVRARYAHPGERIALLNGREVELDEQDLVIADDARAVALAGVMGGADSGVGDGTTDVFLESAFFAPAVVARTARRLELASDAAHRFERGVDFALPRDAIERATALLVEICGGQAGPVAEAQSTAHLPVRTPVGLDVARANRVLGVRLEAEEAAAMLGRLGFAVRRDGRFLEALPPSWRFDMAIPEDLIEEVARVHGYENIEVTLPSAPHVMLPLAEEQRDGHALRTAVAARGYQEVITFSFVDERWEQDFAGSGERVTLANPIAAQMSVMRSTLLASLVDALRYNVARRAERVRLFEVACCFHPDAEGYRQTERLAGVCFGPALAEQWGTPNREVDFFDVRADLEAIVAPGVLSVERASHPALHPGQSARVFIDGVAAGWLGTLHPRLQQRHDIPRPAVMFELDTRALARRPLPAFGGVPRTLPVRRDLALIVDADVSAAALAACLREAGGGIVTDVALFDLYRGERVPNGKKSLAFRVLLQDTEKTLTDAEVESAIAQLVDTARQKHAAELRV